MDVTGQGFQVVQSFLGAEVARAEDVLDPARHQQLLELRRQGRGSVRDVQIAKHQHQHVCKVTFVIQVGYGFPQPPNPLVGVSAASDNIKLGSCAHPLTKTAAIEDDIRCKKRRYVQSNTVFKLCSCRLTLIFL